MATDNSKQARSGFFGKLRTRLNRGKSWLAGDIGGLLRRRLDEDTLEELEEQLLLADVGVEATDRLIADLRSN